MVASSWTLGEDHYGSIKITASGVTLDCQYHSIIFDATLPNAFNCIQGTSTCGIVANAVSSSASPVVIKNCTIQGAFEQGVWLKSTKWAQVFNSTSYAKIGFGVEGGDHNKLTSLTASNNSRYGFYVVATKQQLTADSLLSVGSQGGGFVASASEGIILTSGLFEYSGGKGISWSHCVGGEISDNGALGNTDAGLLIDSQQSGGATVQRNMIQSNNGEGIDVFNSFSVNISNNTATNNDVTAPICNANSNNTGNTWSGNNFGSICGTVPVNH